MIHEPLPNDTVVQLRPNTEAMTPNKPDRTVEVLTALVEQLDEGVRLMTGVIQQQDQRIRALELAMRKIEKKNVPVIVNQHGRPVS